MTTRRHVAIFSLIVAMAFFAALASAQSYGDQVQILTIGAVAFAGEQDQDDGLVDASGYVYHQAAGSGEYQAPLELPEGAEVEQVCLDYFTPTAVPVASVYLQRVTLAAGGQQPWVSAVSGSIVNSLDSGYGEACTDPFSYTIRSRIDVNGTLEPANYQIRVGLYDINAFGAVRIRWKRPVSPPPPTPSFDDVPASDGAFAHIEALAASGITAGCGGGNFCPNATLTRRQMAVFLAKALGLHWVD
jgi:hypothetical protein